MSDQVRQSFYLEPQVEAMMTFVDDNGELRLSAYGLDSLEGAYHLGGGKHYHRYSVRKAAPGLNQPADQIVIDTFTDEENLVAPNRGKDFNGHKLHAVNFLSSSRARSYLETTEIDHVSVHNDDTVVIALRYWGAPVGRVDYTFSGSGVTTISGAQTIFTPQTFTGVAPRIILLSVTDLAESTTNNNSRLYLYPLFNLPSTPSDIRVRYQTDFFSFSTP